MVAATRYVPLLKCVRGSPRRMSTAEWEPYCSWPKRVVRMRGQSAWAW